MSCRQLGLIVWVYTPNLNEDFHCGHDRIRERKKPAESQFIGLGFTGAAGAFNVIRKFPAVLYVYTIQSCSKRFDDGDTAKHIVN